MTDHPTPESGSEPSIEQLARALEEAAKQTIDQQKQLRQLSEEIITKLEGPSNMLTDDCWTYRNKAVNLLKTHLYREKTAGIWP